MSVELVMPSSHLILCHPLLLLPPIPPSIRVFSNESTLCMRWPNYWSFSFSIVPSKEHPGPISFRTDWLDLQHHSSKASILWRSAFFTVQLSHPYMITGKTIALTRRTTVVHESNFLLGFPVSELDSIVVEMSLTQSIIRASRVISISQFCLYIYAICSKYLLLYNKLPLN